MANEITATVTCAVVNGTYRETFAPGSKQITQAAVGAYGGIWVVGSGGEEDMPVGDVSTLGLLCLINLDTTNYVQIGKKVGGVMEASVRLKPGEPNFFRLEPGVTLRAIANTASCKVQMLLLES